MEYHLTKRQDEAWSYLTNDADHAVMYGGAKGGGKSFLGCLWVFQWCERLIELMKIKPSSNPVPIGFMGRKQSVDFDKTTLETFKRIISPQHYQIKELKKEIIIKDTVKIFYGGLDRAETINKFNSAELAFIFIDQAEETRREDIDVLRASLRLTYNGITPPYKELYTANPAQCWLKDDFILAPNDKKVFVQALPSDNPYLPTTYVDTLKDAFKHDPQKVNAYLYGSWDDIGSDDDLVKMSDIKGCFNTQLATWTDHRIISCDVARFGDDKTCIFGFQNSYLKEREIHGKIDLMAIVGRLLYLEQLMNADVLFVIDDTGVGGGVTDRLNELNKKVLAINFAQKPTQPERYKDKRSELFGQAREFIVNRKVNIPETYVNLHGDLCSIKYRIMSDGRLEIEKKDKTKQRLGHSPDEADAFALGIEGIRWMNTEAGQNEFKQMWNDQKPAWVIAREKRAFEREALHSIGNRGYGE